MTSSPTIAAAYTDWMTARATRGQPSPHTVKAYRADIVTVTGLLAEHLHRDGDPLGAVHVEDLAVRPLRAAFAAFAAEHSPASLARAQSTWRGLCAHAVREGWLPGDPMSGIDSARVPKRGPKPLRGEQEAAASLLAFLTDAGRTGRDRWPERDLAVIATLLLTGMRSAEIRGLTRGDIYGTTGDRRVRVTGKGNKERSLPIEPALENVLDVYAVSRATRFPTWKPRLADPLFVDRANTAMTASQLRWLVSSCLRAAGLGGAAERGALVHGLRHTFATILASNGATATELQALLGHASLTTSQNYILAVAREVRASAAANPLYRTLT